MHCPDCNAELAANARFCDQCGRPTGATTDAHPYDEASTGRERFAAALPPGLGRDDQEEVLWQGRYSARAMIGAWLGIALFTIAMIVVAFMLNVSNAGGLAIFVIVVLAWLAGGALLLYRQLNVHYYLTNQRVLFERGLLWRVIDRIEAIDVDDVLFLQGPVERMFGVGTVRIQSSDVSTPEFDLVGVEDARNVATMIDEVRRQERRRRGLHIESV